MTKIYTVEVVKESRALVNGIEAASNAEAAKIAEEMVQKGEVKWAQEDAVSSSIVAAREKKN